MGQLRIVSTSGKAFSGREEAGRLLAQQLSELRGRNAVVLGIPRGGLIVARELAMELDAELDIILARKLRTPGFEELAMGSVTEDGRVFLNRDVVRDIGVSQDAIEQERRFQVAEIERRNMLIRQVRPKVELDGRTVVVTDDGVATGATTQAALWAARAEAPQKLIAAMPVGPYETIQRLSADVDEMLCLRTPPFFSAVGQFYRNFRNVEDSEVVALLEEWQKGRVHR